MAPTEHADYQVRERIDSNIEDPGFDGIDDDQPQIRMPRSQEATQVIVICSVLAVFVLAFIVLVVLQ